MMNNLSNKSLHKNLNKAKAFFSKPSNVLLISFIIVLCVTVLFPLLNFTLDSFIVHSGEVRKIGLDKGSFTLRHWIDLLTDSEYDYAKVIFWKPLANSLLMAIMACLIAVIGGGLMAYFITRTDIPAKKFISTVFIFPYIMPSWSIAMFWENFFKNSNISACYNQVGVLQALTGACVPEWFLYGMLPCAICLGIHYMPFAYILIGGILRNMDANLEEAATILKASRGKIMRRITLPIVMPALISTILLVFASSVSSYTVPTFLNKNNSFTVLSTQMKSLLGNNNYIGQGYVVAIALLMFSLVIMTINNSYTGKRKSFTTVTGKSGQVSLVKLRNWKYLITPLSIILVVFISIVPLISFAVESFLKVPGDLSTFTTYYWTTHDQIELRMFV
ncbi:MAG: ABC transporter permease subunit, partial [Clostridia bacterium]